MPEAQAVETEKPTKSEQSEHDETDKQWAMGAHLSPFLGFVIPLGNFLGPLVVMLLQDDDQGFVREQAREALNFQIALFVYVILSIVTLIGPFLVGLVGVILMIKAAVAAREGKVYDYPFIFRLV